MSHSETDTCFDVLTIGHSNHPIERFMSLLQHPGATAIVDVRSTPASRRFPWFSAKRLRDHLERISIAYLPMGDTLGGRPRDASLFRDGVADYEAMAGTDAFRAGIDKVVAMAPRVRASLMCAEREPLDCHRCLLVAPALAARGLRIGHVLADGSIVSHQAIEDRLLAQFGEDDLFAGGRHTRLAEAYRRRARAVAYRSGR
jgi:uncharacterized protein (DUF488 family)